MFYICNQIRQLNMENTISFNKETYLNLKKEYGVSVKKGKESFVFEGKELLTDYAKYVIQYLETKFK